MRIRRSSRGLRDSVKDRFSCFTRASSERGNDSFFLCSRVPYYFSISLLLVFPGDFLQSFLERLFSQFDRFRVNERFQILADFTLVPLVEDEFFDRDLRADLARLGVADWGGST